MSSELVAKDHWLKVTYGWMEKAAKVADLPGVKKGADQSAALAAYAKKQREPLAKVNEMQVARLCHMREGGQILRDIPQARGRPQKNSSRAGGIKGPAMERAGLGVGEAARWELLTDVSNAEWADIVSDIAAADDEVCRTDVLKAIRQRKRGAQGTSVLDDCPEGEYRTIVVDPPWPMQKIDRDVRPAQDVMPYRTPTIEEITDWDGVKGVTPEGGAHLYLWTTQRFLPPAFGVMAKWGFEYVFAMVWHKPGGFQPVGLPQYNCEFVLYGRTKGAKFSDTKGFDCCFQAPRGEHSEKPAEFYELIKRVSPGPRIDIFNRRTHDGFDSWGDEQGKLDAVR